MPEAKFKFRTITLDEEPHDRSAWQDLLQEMVCQREDGAGCDRLLTLSRGLPYFTVTFPLDMADDEVDQAVEEIARDGDELLRRDRRSRTRAAMAALEERERVQESLRQTRKALAIAEDARKGITETADLVGAVQKLVRAAGSIINAWSWMG